MNTNPWIGGAPTPTPHRTIDVVFVKDGKEKVVSVRFVGFDSQMRKIIPAMVADGYTVEDIRGEL